MYTAKNVDVTRFIEALRDSRDYQLNQYNLKCAEAKAFFNGYDACVEDVMGMFHCSNYEVREGENE